MLHTGDTPEMQDTGELEPILPAWLKEARQQNRESVDSEEMPSSLPTAQKPRITPPDLLAGLASQSDAEDEEVPDWLSQINPLGETSMPSQSSSGKEHAPADFFSQFSKSESIELPTADETSQDVSDILPSENNVGSMQNLDAPNALDNWLSGNSGNLDDTEFNFSDGLGDQSLLIDDQDEFKTSKPFLEQSAKGTENSVSAEVNENSLTGTNDLGDLDWLNTMGGSSVHEQETSQSSPDGSSDEMGWLNSLGGAPLIDEPKTPVPSTSNGENVDWLSNLEDRSLPQDTKENSEGLIQNGDQDWLNNPGGQSPAFVDEPEQNLTGDGSQNDSSWLDAFAPTDSSAGDFSSIADESDPDWLKDAIEEPSMPPPGSLSMEWLTDDDNSQKEDTRYKETENASLPTPSTESPMGDFDSLFDVSMDGFEVDESRIGALSDIENQGSIDPDDESLAPVNLPSWVQAMRPVESALRGQSNGDADQIEEEDGPLAGFAGVIPSAPVGSSQRPKAISLKLQVSEEQHAGAAILEEIITGETAGRSIRSTSTLTPQNNLRMIISAIMIVSLSIVLFIGSRTMPIVASASANELSNLIQSIPENSQALVVIDYDPSLAGELEVAAGPILDQLALSRKTMFTLLSTSPTGSALGNQLMSKTGLANALPDGLGYLDGVNYFNLGYLPGGSSGIAGFLMEPRSVKPTIGADALADYSVVILLTDNTESGRVWVEQLELAKSRFPELAGRPLFVASSAQAGPMLQPYLFSGQIDILINGLADAAKYEFVNNTRPGVARNYWDAFGVGLLLAVLLIIFGSVLSLLSGMRERRPARGQG